MQQPKTIILFLISLIVFSIINSTFFILTEDFDKNEWLRKFWKKWDPSPTTPENERKDEFIRRVFYAKENFGNEWNYRQTKYLTEEYLRTGWSMAPWDSRGELYIKYGEPDFRDASYGINQEIWTYYRYNVDFIVKPYVTNIFGNGIQPGPMNKIMHHWASSRIQSEFIYKPEFKFDVFRNYEPLKHFKLSYQINKIEQESKLINVSYVLSGDELKFKKMKDQYKAQFEQSYVVYNEDLKEVTGNIESKELIAQTKDETEKTDNFTVNFGVNLSAGNYTLALRIKDLNSNKLGIFLKEIHID